MAAAGGGLGKAYLDSLNYLRELINQTEAGVAEIAAEFYGTDDRSSYEGYLLSCNEQLRRANNQLLRSSVPLEAVDGEVRLVALLNSLRGIRSDCVDFVTRFRGKLRAAADGLEAACGRFRGSVFRSLKLSCVSCHSSDSSVRLEVSRRYAERAAGYADGIGRTMADAEALLKSFGGRIHQDLYTDDRLSGRVLVSCDPKAFPVLRLVPDVVDKMEVVCSAAREWIDRDQEYVKEVNEYIRQTRTVTRMREEDLRVKMERNKRLTKAAKTASILLQSNRRKLQRMEGELGRLDEELNSCRQRRRFIFGEKRQKENMAEFLNLTMSQVKRNYSVQIKRSRLIQQVKMLEQSLDEMEKNLYAIREQITEKSHEKLLMVEKVESSLRSYRSVKSDLETLNANLSQLSRSLRSLSVQLQELEIIQMVKTCPEQTDMVYDRPCSVRFAPSLLSKLQRKRKIKNPR